MLRRAALAERSFLTMIERQSPLRYTDDIIHAGLGKSRVFLEESRGKKRRDARQVRKQLDRRTRRHKKLVYVLQRAGECRAA